MFGAGSVSRSPAMGLIVVAIPPPPAAQPSIFSRSLPVPAPRKDDQVPLKNVAVSAKLTGYTVGISSVLTYVNSGSDPLEVLFRFPVDESYAVVGLEAVLAGHRIKAALKEKEEARQEYDDAMASGLTAALGEETTGDIFSISLGNLPPKSDAEIRLQLVAELPLDDEGRVVFSLPTVLKPRYTPAGSSDPLQATGAAGQTRQHAVFALTLDVMNAASVSDVSSSTHALSTQRDGDKLVVSITESTPLDKDLVVMVTHKDPHMPIAIPEPGNPTLSQRTYMGSPAVMLNFFPAFDTKRAACEFIFVIDRSGSMSGGYMASAKETLKLFLKSIPPGCYFNIIGFGSTFKVMFGYSEEYNQQSLDRAIQETDKMFANLGGTELLPPLKHIYSQPLLPGLPRQVFVLTDGSVSNTNACIQEVRRHVSHTRVFTFGIGSGASTELVRGLARAGNGTAEFVQGEERMQPKVIASLKRALQPAVTDFEVEFNVPSGFQALQAPANPPVLFSGDKATIFGIFKSKALSDDPLQAPVSGTATLRGKVLGNPFEHSIQFNIPEAPPLHHDQSTVVHQLASKALIRDWQDSNCQKKEIIDLSIESSVLSSHTAYIAVDEEQDKPIEGAIKVWDILAPTPGGGLLGASGMTFSFGGGFGGLGSQALGGPPPPMLNTQAVDMLSVCTYSSSSYQPTAALFDSSQDDLLGGPPPPTLSGASNDLFSRGPPSPPGGGQLFGGPPPPPSGGGLFRGPPPPEYRGFSGGPPPPQGGGFFGGPPPPQGGGLFGGPPPPEVRGFFGGPPPPQGGGLFGGPPPPGLGGPPLQPTVVGTSPQSMGLSQQQARVTSQSPFGSSVTTATSSGPLTTIISLQTAQGYWQLEEVAAQVFHHEVSQLMAECPVTCDRSVWATMLVLVYLEVKFAGQKDEWELVAMKGEMWLEDSADGNTLTELREAAKNCM